jgi:hypothetical protein
VLLAQHFGPAVSVAIAQVIFTNNPPTNLARVVPGLDPANIETDGLSDVVRRASSTLHGEVLRVLVGVLVKLGIWPLDWRVRF